MYCFYMQPTPPHSSNTNCYALGAGEVIMDLDQRKLNSRNLCEFRGCIREKAPRICGSCPPPQFCFEHYDEFYFKQLQKENFGGNQILQRPPGR